MVYPLTSTIVLVRYKNPFVTKYTICNGELSIEQKRGVITLLPPPPKKNITFKELKANFTLKYRLQN